jgi:hypothetical protein
MPLTFVVGCIALGLFCVVWLVLDIRQERRREERRRQVRIDPAWRMDEERERVLAAAADPLLYRGPKGTRTAQMKRPQ